VNDGSVTAAEESRCRIQSRNSESSVDTQLADRRYAAHRYQQEPAHAGKAEPIVRIAHFVGVAKTQTDLDGSGTTDTAERIARCGAELQIPSVIKSSVELQGALSSSIQELAGHPKTVVTQRYIHLSPTCSGRRRTKLASA